jgi:hypothetical protein
LGHAFAQVGPGEPLHTWRHSYEQEQFHGTIAHWRAPPPDVAVGWAFAVALGCAPADGFGNAWAVVLGCALPGAVALACALAGGLVRAIAVALGPEMGASAEPASLAQAEPRMTARSPTVRTTTGG